MKIAYRFLRKAKFILFRYLLPISQSLLGLLIADVGVFQKNKISVPTKTRTFKKKTNLAQTKNQTHIFF